MVFNSYTVIRPLFNAQDGDTMPDFCDLSSITPDFDSKQLYDILGVVLFIEPKRTKTKRDGSQVDVRELVIIDHRFWSFYSKCSKKGYFRAFLVISRAESDRKRRRS